MGIRRLTLTRAIRVARGNDVACREAGDTKSTLISASWPSYTLSSMIGPKNRNIKMCHSAKITSEIFYSRHFASKCHIRHNSSYSASIAMVTYCFNLPAILAVSVMHSSSRVISKRISENGGHVNIRKTRRVALLYIPIL